MPISYKYSAFHKILDRQQNGNFTLTLEQGEWGEFACSVCGCHQNYHRKVIENTPVKYVNEVLYTKCHKIHNFDLSNSVDGCQEFIPCSRDVFTCAVCGCHMGFHRNWITKEK